MVSFVRTDAPGAPRSVVVSTVVIFFNHEHSGSRFMLKARRVAEWLLRAIIILHCSFNNNNNNVTTMASDPNDAPKETAKWTRFLPEAFGIRESIRQSPYRWCARER